jgi:hypothetical protein
VPAESGEKRGRAVRAVLCVQAAKKPPFLLTQNQPPKTGGPQVKIAACRGPSGVSSASPRHHGTPRTLVYLRRPAASFPRRNRRRG